MSAITLQEMLDAGVHYGHQTSRWNPKMKRFIFGERDGVHILDLQQTLPLFEKAYDFVHSHAAHGGGVLFVATKKQAQDVVKEAAKSCGMYYMTNRWLGGTLTNLKTVKESIGRLNKLEPLVLPVLAQKKITELCKEGTVAVSSSDVERVKLALDTVPGASLTEHESNRLNAIISAPTLDLDALRAFFEPKLAFLRNSTTLTKREGLLRCREYEKLEANLGGIRKMKDQPSAIFVVDVNKEHIAVSEARRLGIKVIALVDTNTDPSGVDFPIPANDDAIRSIQLFADRIAQAVNSARTNKRSSSSSEEVEAPRSGRSVEFINIGAGAESATDLA